MVQFSYSKALAFVGLFSSQIVLPSVSAQRLAVQKGWADSYEVDGKCYCDTNFDHGVGEFMLDTPCGGQIKIRDLCSELGEGSTEGRKYYNDIQCGNGPPNTHDILDEIWCPGRVDLGVGDESGCEDKGPLFLFPMCGEDSDAQGVVVNSNGGGEDPGPVISENMPVLTQMESCEIRGYSDLDFPNHDVGIVDDTVSDEACVEACIVNEKCNAVTRKLDDGTCFLKGVEANSVPMDVRLGFNSYLVLCGSTAGVSFDEAAECNCEEDPDCEGCTVMTEENVQLENTEEQQSQQGSEPSGDVFSDILVISLPSKTATSIGSDGIIVLDDYLTGFNIRVEVEDEAEIRDILFEWQDHTKTERRSPFDMFGSNGMWPTPEVGTHTVHLTATKRDGTSYEMTLELEFQ